MTTPSREVTERSRHGAPLVAGVVEEALQVADQRAELARAEHLRRRLEALPEASPERAELERHYANALLAAAALRALGRGAR